MGFSRQTGTSVLADAAAQCLRATVSFRVRGQTSSTLPLVLLVCIVAGLTLAMTRAGTCCPPVETPTSR